MAVLPSHAPSGMQVRMQICFGTSVSMCDVLNVQLFYVNTISIEMQT